MGPFKAVSCGKNRKRLITVCRFWHPCYGPKDAGITWVENQILSTPSGRAWASIRIDRLEVWARHAYLRSSDLSINCQIVPVPESERMRRSPDLLVAFAR